jgi:hypothetical protein
VFESPWAHPSHSFIPNFSFRVVFGKRPYNGILPVNDLLLILRLQSEILVRLNGIRSRPPREGWQRVHTRNVLWVSSRCPICEFACPDTGVRSPGNKWHTVRSMVKCCNCDWEGKEEELVEEPGNLMFYDHVLINSLKDVEVTRVNFLCPKCGAMIKSRRLINGMVMQK